MKTTYAIVTGLMFLIPVPKMEAQSFFSQNATWLKNQIKQIALIEVYIKDAEKGYSIAKKGLATIGAIKKGDFHLHLDHFNGLTAINPAIKKYSEALDILRWQSAIKALYKKSNDDYAESVFRHLMEAATADTEVLTTLLAAGNYALSDDERLKAVHRIYINMKDKYVFAKSFTTDRQLLHLQELKDKNNLNMRLLLHDLR